MNHFFLMLYIAFLVSCLLSLFRAHRQAMRRARNAAEILRQWQRWYREAIPRYTRVALEEKTDEFLDQWPHK